MLRLLPTLAIATLLLPTTVVFGGDASACQAPAQTMLDTLLPFAETIAGKPLYVTLKFDAAGKGAAEYMLSGTNFLGMVGSDQIRITPGLCELSVRDQRVILAHELGHGIDRIKNTDFYAPLAQSAWPEWALRPAEISATARGLQIYRLASFEQADFFEVFTPSIQGWHVDNAMRLIAEIEKRPRN